MNRIFQLFYKRLRPIQHARRLGVTVGENCRLIDVSFSTEPYLVTLGDHVSATKTRFETHDGGVWVIRDRHPELDVIKPIVVGDNVFFGFGAIVLPGTTIGNNCVIGAGAVVSGHIPDNSIAVGVPARVIRSLEAYERKALSQGLATKLLAPSQKREHLVRHFGGRAR